MERIAWVWRGRWPSQSVPAAWAHASSSSFSVSGAVMASEGRLNEMAPQKDGPAERENLQVPIPDERPQSFP